MSQQIPDAALKKHIAILGMNGSGKTSVAKSQVIEPALAAGERVCNIDPTGVGWGLRLSASGKSKGYAIYIVGGDHADFPLFRRDGKAWAEIVGTSSDSFVFDTSQMTVEDRSLWFTDFAETLIRKNKGPLKLVLDEAHLFAPQGGSKAGGVAPKMLHATNNLLALGRSRGLRVTMISQRPAKLHKDSLTQAHTLIAMSLMAPQDRNAVEDWIADQADVELGKEIIASLPSLEPGEGWIWAPKEHVLARVRFARPRTFDSSSAPEDGDHDELKLSPINPDAIKEKLATVAKETMANDIPTLRKTIAELQKQVRDRPTETVATPDPEAEQRGYARGKIDGYADAIKGVTAEFREVIGALDGMESTFTNIRAAAAQVQEWAKRPAPQPTAQPVRVVRQAPPPRPVRAATNGHAKPGAALPRAKRRVLTALAQYPGGRTKNQVAVLTGYAVNGGGFNNAISSLRTSGYLVGSGDNLDITDTGLEALGSFDPLPTGDALLNHWLGQLGKAERETLRVVAAAWPEALTKEEVAAQAGYAADGGGFNNAVSRLRTLELVAGRGELKASDDLFG